MQKYARFCSGNFLLFPTLFLTLPHPHLLSARNAHKCWWLSPNKPNRSAETSMQATQHCWWHALAPCGMQHNAWVSAHVCVLYTTRVTFLNLSLFQPLFFTFSLLFITCTLHLFSSIFSIHLCYDFHCLLLLLIPFSLHLCKCCRQVLINENKIQPKFILLSFQLQLRSFWVSRFFLPLLFIILQIMVAKVW